MLKSIKIRLYPNKQQTQYINSLLGSCRFVYNHCMNLKITKYKEDGTQISYDDLSKYLFNDLRKNESYTWLKEQLSNPLQQSLRNMDGAFRKHFKSKGKIGFPKFKSKYEHRQSCKLTSMFKTNNYLSNYLTLSNNLNNIKFRCSDRYKTYLDKNILGIRSATLTKTPSGNYHLSILVEGVNDKQVKPSNKSTGIDLGISTLVTLSNGEYFENPKWVKKYEKQLTKLQRRLSKKVKGSNNRFKARIKVAKLHEKIANKRKNNLHNITSKIINENQVIVIEDLNVNGMSKNRKLSKAIMDLGLFEFKRQLTYKSEWYGRELVKVSRWFPSSKKCSNCGNNKHKLPLNIRVYKCTCGHKQDRDLNASINILNEGIRILSL